MDKDIERNLGEQPIRAVMLKHDLSAHSLVAASTEQLTHKMVARAAKGRRLSRNAQKKVLRALNQAAAQNYALSDLFLY